MVLEKKHAGPRQCGSRSLAVDYVENMEGASRSYRNLCQVLIILILNIGQANTS